MKRIIFFLLFLNFSFGFADNLDTIENVINKAKSIKAEFTQISKIKGFEEESKFDGYLYISKPDKIKIEYVSPEKNIIFVENNKVIIYNPKDKQAMISQLSNQFIVVKLFNIIASNESFKKLFNIINEEKNNKEISITLKPKNDNQLESVKLTFLNKSYKLKQIKIVDKEGNQIIVNFKRFEFINKKLPLEFKLPEGVQIFYQ